MCERKLCECGCGQPTKISKVTETARGVVAGEPRRFLSGHHSRIRHEVSPDDLARRRPKVAKLYQAGRSLKEIGAELGLTKMQVHTDVVALRKAGALPPARTCQAVTNSGKRCGSPASADGFCGGHRPSSGRPPSELPVPIEKLAQRYTAGETLAAIAADIGIDARLLGKRLKKAGYPIRARGCQKGKAPWRYDWLKTDEIVNLWNAGLPMTDIARKFGVSYSCIWYRLVEALGKLTDQQLRRLYVDEELPLGQVADHLGCSKYEVSQRLSRLGVSCRTGGRARKQEIANKATIRQVQLAAAQRGRPPGTDLTEKQADVLNVLRASPQPLSSRRISEVCKAMPRKWEGIGSGAISSCARGLEARGLVCSVMSRGAGHYRGRNVLVWFPADEHAAIAENAEDAQRLREIQILIEDQEREEIRGDGEVGHSWDRSLDAPITEDGFTILDTLGDYDEALGDAA